MLDQNTDRMWYVIGALVVGAGIILVANKSIPDIFSKVTDQFKSTSEQGTDSIKNIHPYVNLIPAELSNKEWSGDGQWKKEFLPTVDLAPIIDGSDLNQRYTLIFDMKSTDVSTYDRVDVYIQNGTTNRYKLKVDGYVGQKGAWNYHIDGVSEDWKTYTIENVYFVKDTHYDTETKAYLSFYGIYSTNNAPNVRNLKLYANP